MKKRMGEIYQNIEETASTKVKMLLSGEVVNNEMANSLTHLFGLVLSAAGLAILVVLASIKATAWHIVSFSIYGATLILLYLCSTLYHSFHMYPKIKKIFKVMDHSAIYLLIAGSYTPFTLINLHGAWGWTIFGIIWGLTLLGIIFKVFLVHRFQLLSTIIYLLMGWLIIIAIKPLIDAVELPGLIWLVSGGLCYSAGVYFYIKDDKPYYHAIWHLFVLAGSICHFFGILFYVLPTPV